jgi:hypothetical protein
MLPKLTEAQREVLLAIPGVEAVTWRAVKLANGLVVPAGDVVVAEEAWMVTVRASGCACEVCHEGRLLILPAVRKFTVFGPRWTAMHGYEKVCPTARWEVIEGLNTEESVKAGLLSGDFRRGQLNQRAAVALLDDRVAWESQKETTDG